MRGFTLIELVMIIVILGILAAVAIPKFIGLQDSSRRAAADGAIGAIRTAVSGYYAAQATSSDPLGATFPSAIAADLFAYNQIPEFHAPYSFSYDSSNGIVTRTSS